jgi:arylformamidase
MIEYKTIYDISVMLGEESIDYPGDTPYSRESLSTMQEGGVYELSKLQLSAHSGTHIDAPAHFIKQGKTIEQYESDSFILSTVVVDMGNRPVCLPEDLLDIDIQPGEALLFRTENSTSGRCRNGVFSEEFVFITKETAEVCVEKKISLVGLDYITIEQYGNDAFDAHQTLLSADVLILEGIDLGNVPAGRYTLLCLPLKMKGAEASPVRAILLA